SRRRGNRSSGCCRRCGWCRRGGRIRSAGRSEGGSRTDALLLRVLRRELVRALVVEIRAHDQMAHDLVRVLHPPIELGQAALGLVHEEVVVAFVEFFDGIGEATAAPRFFVLERGARSLGDALELTDQRRRLFLRQLRRKDEQDFISPHRSSFWPSGTPPLRWSKELADCQKNFPDPV